MEHAAVQSSAEEVQAAHDVLVTEKIRLEAEVARLVASVAGFPAKEEAFQASLDAAKGMREEAEAT